MNTTSYLHALDGRLRIKSPIVKGAPEKAREAEQQLGTCLGITQVTANSLTGSILVHYNPSGITQKELLDELRSLGYCQETLGFQPAKSDTSVAQNGFSRDIVKTVVISTLEFTVQRLVYALI